MRDPKREGAHACGLSLQQALNLNLNPSDTPTAGQCLHAALNFEPEVLRDAKGGEQHACAWLVAAWSMPLAASRCSSEGHLRECWCAHVPALNDAPHLLRRSSSLCIHTSPCLQPEASLFPCCPRSTTNQARILLAKRYVEEAYCRMVGCSYTAATDSLPAATPVGAAAQQLPPQQPSQQQIPQYRQQQQQAGAAGAAAAGAGGAAGGAPAPKRQRTTGAGGFGALGGGGDLLLSFDEIIEACGGSGAGNTAIRCLCGRSSETGSMVQCEAPQCHVWQHAECVAAPRVDAGAHGARKQHYCERCRIARADPFWEVFDANLFSPMRVNVTGRNVAMGANVVPVGWGRGCWVGCGAGGWGWGLEGAEEGSQRFVWRRCACVFGLVWWVGFGAWRGLHRWVGRHHVCDFVDDGLNGRHQCALLLWHNTGVVVACGRERAGCSGSSGCTRRSAH